MSDELTPATLDELLATWREWKGALETVLPMGRLVALAWVSAGFVTVRYLPVASLVMNSCSFLMSCAP
jgi:hypothetical protein